MIPVLQYRTAVLHRAREMHILSPDLIRGLTERWPLRVV